MHDHTRARCQCVRTCFEVFVDGTMKLADESVSQRVDGVVSGSGCPQTSRTCDAADTTLLSVSC